MFHPVPDPANTTAGIEGGQKAAQNPTQQPHANGRNQSYDEARKTKNPAICRAFQESAVGCDGTNNYLMGAVGFEPTKA
ncbi:MAG: hypothetical protein IT448_03590 [Phycisphaerales bacterium]|nr:hypothetical protein [Phycisphaerales bacterium]